MQVTDTQSRPWSRLLLDSRTFVFFVVFAAVFWLNAALARYRFNVAIAVVASVPLLFLLVRAAYLSRQHHELAGSTGHGDVGVHRPKPFRTDAQSPGGSSAP